MQEVIDSAQNYDILTLDVPTAFLGCPLSEEIDMWLPDEAFFRSKGISQQLTAPYTPEQNGKSERLNQIIFQIARKILKFSGMPDRYWAEVALYAVYVKNCIPDKTGISMYERWTQRMPDLSHMRIFGCKAYVFRPSEITRAGDITL